MHYMETYNASEGFFGIQDSPNDSSMLLMLDYGVFYEFIPLEEINAESPTVVPLEGVETGRYGYHHVVRIMAVYDRRYRDVYIEKAIQIRHYGPHKILY